MLQSSEMIGESEIGSHFSSWQNNELTKMTTRRDSPKSSQKNDEGTLDDSQAFQKAEDSFAIWATRMMRRLGVLQ